MFILIGIAVVASLYIVLYEPVDDWLYDRAYRQEVAKLKSSSTETDKPVDKPVDNSV